VNTGKKQFKMCDQIIQGKMGDGKVLVGLFLNQGDDMGFAFEFTDAKVLRKMAADLDKLADSIDPAFGG
jgi:hypothetical protein